MSVRLRFKRVGMKKQAYYRLVAVDRRSARDGAEIEILGHYNPKDKENKISLNSERINYWISCGAQLSDTARTLLQKSGHFAKSDSKPSESSPTA